MKYNCINLKEDNMKKILRKILVALIVASVGYGVYASQQDVEMSDLAMANVEALAGGESDGGYHITCYSGIGSAFLCECSSCTWQCIGTSMRGTCY